MTTDIELWRQITNGDKTAFEKLYRRYYSPLLGYAIRMQYDEETIKDCIQDLFVKIYTNHHQLPPLKYVKPYLYKALSNALMDKTKSVRNNTVSTDELMSISIEDEGLLVLFKENDEDFKKACLLKNALEQLPAKQKDALYFHFIQEFSWQEMAEIFEMSEHSCMNLVGRGIANLRTFIKKSPSE